MSLAGEICIVLEGWIARKGGGDPADGKDSATAAALAAGPGGSPAAHAKSVQTAAVQERARPLLLQLILSGEVEITYAATAQTHPLPLLLGKLVLVQVVVKSLLT